MRLRIKDPKALRCYWIGAAILIFAMLAGLLMALEVFNRRITLTIALAWFPMMGVSVLFLRKASSIEKAIGGRPYYDPPKDPAQRAQALALERRWYGITVGVIVALAVLAWLPIWPFEVPAALRISLTGGPYLIGKRMRSIEQRFAEAEAETAADSSED